MSANTRDIAALRAEVCAFEAGGASDLVAIHKGSRPNKQHNKNTTVQLLLQLAVPGFVYICSLLESEALWFATQAIEREARDDGRRTKLQARLDRAIPG